MSKELVIVFRDKKARAIETFVHLGGHGARMDLDAFIDRVAELYGSPAMTFTKKGLLAGIQAAVAQAVLEMKQKTVGVAAQNLEPEPPSAA